VSNRPFSETAIVTKASEKFKLHKLTFWSFSALQMAKSLMNQLGRRICIPVLIAVFVLSANTCVAAADDYSTRSASQLIDDLPQIDSESLAIADYAMYGTFLANDAAISLKLSVFGVPSSRIPAQIRELVRRGPLALPELIKHLDDRRPTKWEVGNKPGYSLSQIPRDAYWWTDFSDEYDPRSSRPSDEKPRTGKMPMMKEFQGRYTMKVADVCYTLIGQIVNRRLVGVHAQPSAGLMVNSPTESPALAEEVRKDWGKADAEELRQSLLADVRATTHSEKWYTKNFNNSALERLRLYFPDTYNALEGDDLKKKMQFEEDEVKRASSQEN
jgi:hypothetical protein